MKIIQTILVFIFLLISIASLEAQEKNEGRDIIFRGKVTSLATGKAVSFATVVKSAYNVGTISDTLGYFALRMKVGELIKVSAIGFVTEYIYVRDSMVAGETFYKDIKLQTEYYKLAEINIYDIRWQEFKDAILEMEVPDNRAELIEEWMSSALTKEFISGLRASTPGISINLQSKYDKQRILVAQLEADKDLQRKASAKMYYLAQRFTGLIDKDLMNFVNFCGFSTEYILTNNDYEITVRIKRIYEVYNRKK